MGKARIFLTNDDGINSPGLCAAASALRNVGRLSIVAPLRQQTAMGRAHTGDPEATLLPREYRADGEEIHAFACDASPASTIGHGLMVLKGNLPDLVVSGINYGENLGANITSSGTVGAALEAAARGVPSIAISLETSIDAHRGYSSMNWEVAQYFLEYFARAVLKNGLPHDVHVLKIDVPGKATFDTQWRLTRQSVGSYYETAIENPTMLSKRSDAVVRKQREFSIPSETDVYAFNVDTVVSVTPLSLDLTSRTDFSSIHAWISG